MAGTEAGQYALIPAFILMGILSFASGAIGGTNLYLIEQYVCREHYNIQHRSLVDESLCKLPEIQSKVVQINGVYTFLGFILGERFALPEEEYTDCFSSRPHWAVGRTGSCLGEEDGPFLERA